VSGPAQQQVRGVKTIDFAGHKEEVYGMILRANMPLLRSFVHADRNL
jgi:hypothetical protein